MKKNIDVSIIVVSFNTKKQTIDCVLSVYKEGSNIKREVIVVDNASDDNTVEELNKLKNDNLTIIQNEKNLGFSKAVNIGIKKAKGKYVYLLNSDTKLLRGSLKKLIDYAEKNNENLAVVSPKLVNLDNSIQESVYRFPTLTMYLKQYILGIGRDLDKYAPKGNKPVEVDVATMAAFLITPKGLKQVGLLDERYFMYFEDFQYCKNAKELGLKVIYFPKSRVYHLHGKSGKTLAKKVDQWKRLIPSSKIYHGWVKYWIFYTISWIGQKLGRK